MFRFLSTLFFLLSATFLFAQNRCGFDEKLAELLVQNPELTEVRQQIERQTQEWIEDHSENSSREVITIPVVIHVVYKTDQQNISSEQIWSQIDVLNEDYRRLNSDASNTPSAFQGVAADTEIEFCLASEDPNGNWTSGITRTETDVTSWNASDNVKYTSMGGKDGWNPSKYLNIWVCNIGAGYLGYAYPPGVSLSLDGVVIGYKYFGTTGTVSATYNKGRTTTHEVGHWLNLYHLWGVNPSNSNCNEDDEVNDTPVQSNPHFDCPSFPQTSCNNGANGDMFMNFMDYTDDACMNLFTQGQKTRMMATLNTSRASVKNAVSCNAVGVEEKGELDLSVYPNPASGQVNIILDEIHELLQYRFVNVLGVVTKEGQMQRRATIDVSELKSGVYFLELYQNGKLLAAEKLLLRPIE
jgi:hypothetical protein